MPAAAAGLSERERLLAIERAAVRAWPAGETRDVDGWLWRYSGGGSQRANSVSALAYRARDEAPWKRELPEEIFLNDVLPYASMNERRDNWRKDFYDRVKPLIEGADSPGQAAALINKKFFPLVKVRYSTKRPKADQSPYESIEAGLASCTGLSILLVDACRAVGVPARFAGTPPSCA